MWSMLHVRPPQSQVLRCRRKWEDIYSISAASRDVAISLSLVFIPGVVPAPDDNIISVSNN